MKKQVLQKNLLKYAALIAVIFTMCTSCVTQKNIEYLQEKEDFKTYNDPLISDYKLKPNDELYIQIKSLDDPSTNVFQQGGTQPAMMNNLTPYSASMTSYFIDREGYVQLPVLGYMFVEDKTLNEVSSMLQDSLEFILSKPTVTVKLVNRFISVLGEVQRPGHYSYSKEKLTIFDALGMAGDMNEYADRNDVILIRNEKNENQRITIDLTNSELMASNYYYLRPNDMIYIKPMKKKFWGMRQFPFSILLSSITTALLIYQVAK